MRDPNACEALPDGIDGIEPGCVCPHNIYYHKQQVFANREDVADSVERIFRLINSAQLGLVSESTLDPLSVTELITARAEIDRQQRVRAQQREWDAQRTQEAQANQKFKPSFDR